MAETNSEVEESFEMSGAATNDKDLNEVALDHAWKWFEYHASQRMTMIRFYLLATGGIAAGLGFLLAAHENVLAALLSFVGILTSIAFKRLDKRVSDLVKIGEDALKPEQAKIGATLKSQTFEICRIAGERPKGFSYPYTYGENFRLLFNVLVIGFAVMTIISVARSIEPYGAQILGWVCHR